MYVLILQHNNPRPHTANMTKAAIQEFDWDWRFFTTALLSWLPPLPPSLQQSARRGVSFSNDPELHNWLDEFFTAKPADFFKRGIENLTGRWEANNGGYKLID
jgi:hypothetical protein